MITPHLPPRQEWERHLFKNALLAMGLLQRFYNHRSLLLEALVGAMPSVASARPRVGWAGRCHLPISHPCPPVFFARPSIILPLPALLLCLPILLPHRPSIFPPTPTTEKELHNLRKRTICHLKTTFVNIFDKVGWSMEKLLPSQH